MMRADPSRPPRRDGRRERRKFKLASCRACGIRPGLMITAAASSSGCLPGRVYPLCATYPRPAAERRRLRLRRPRCFLPRSLMPPLPRHAPRRTWVGIVFGVVI